MPERTAPAFANWEYPASGCWQREAKVGSPQNHAAGRGFAPEAALLFRASIGSARSTRSCRKHRRPLAAHDRWRKSLQRPACQVRNGLAVSDWRRDHTRSCRRAGSVIPHFAVSPGFQKTKRVPRPEGPQSRGHTPHLSPEGFDMRILKIWTRTSWRKCQRVPSRRLRASRLAVQTLH
jgi:hypothetical protein